MLDRDEVEAREEALRARARTLPDDRRRELYARAERELKDPDTYAVLNWLFLAGLHHFYLGRVARGALNLGLFLAGVAAIVAGAVLAGAALIFGVTVVELWALFRSGITVQDHNNRVMARLLDELAGNGAGAARSTTVSDS